jgi:hypothetical protein
MHPVQTLTTAVTITVDTTEDTETTVAPAVVTKAVALASRVGLTRLKAAVQCVPGFLQSGRLTLGNQISSAVACSADICFIKSAIRDRWRLPIRRHGAKNRITMPLASSAVPSIVCAGRRSFDRCDSSRLGYVNKARAAGVDRSQTKTGMTDASPCARARTHCSESATGVARST